MAAKTDSKAKDKISKKLAGPSKTTAVTMSMKKKPSMNTCWLKILFISAPLMSHLMMKRNN